MFLTRAGLQSKWNEEILNTNLTDITNSGRVMLRWTLSRIRDCEGQGGATRDS